MTEKILKLISTIYNIDECKDKEFSFTLNYKEVVKRSGKYKTHKGGFMEHTGWDIPILNDDGLKLISDALSKEENIESFNFTIMFESGINHELFERGYEKGWNSCKFIFYGKEKIFCVFDSLGDYSTFESSKFYHYFNGKDVYINEDKMKETIIMLLELKNSVIDNGSKILNKLDELSLILTKNN